MNIRETIWWKEKRISMENFGKLLNKDKKNEARKNIIEKE